MNKARRDTLAPLVEAIDTCRSALDAGLDALRATWPTDGDLLLAERMAAFVSALRGLAEEEGQIDNLESTVRQEADDEQESFDNLPEGLQQAERGQRMEEAASRLQQAADLLSDVGGELREAAKTADLLDDEDMLTDQNRDEALIARDEVLEALEACVRSLEEARDEVSEAIAC